MVFFSGLRGAVAFACVTSFPDTNGNKNAFILTTMVIIFATVFLMGGTTSKVLDALGIEVDVDEAAYLENKKREAAKEREEQEHDHKPKNTIEKFLNFDKNYISPFLLRDYSASDARREDGGISLRTMGDNTDGDSDSTHSFHMQDSSQLIPFKNIQSQNLTDAGFASSSSGGLELTPRNGGEKRGGGVERQKSSIFDFGRIKESSESQNDGNPHHDENP
jgi:hypothetical protein